MNKIIVLALSLILITLTGCSRTERYTGTGAAVGALTGLAISGDAGGALVGGALGAGVGYVGAKATERHYYRSHYRHHNRHYYYAD